MQILILLGGVASAMAADPTSTPASRPASSGRMESIRFATTRPMPTLDVLPELEPVRRLIAVGVDRLPEGSLLVGSVTAGQHAFGLKPTQVTTLGAGFKSVYGQIAADPVFRGLGSALSEAVSQDANRGGHYFLYRPLEINATKPAIIFLHGFGGNFQFYAWLLKEHFPDRVIILPSYGIAWAQRGRDHLRDVLAHVRGRLTAVEGETLARPWLMAISAGGPAGFAFYNDAPDRFSGYVCIASCPRRDQVPLLRHDVRVLMLNGVADDRFPIAAVRQVVRPLVGRLAELDFREVEGDHFFLLSSREATFQRIEAFVSQLRP